MFIIIIICERMIIDFTRSRTVGNMRPDEWGSGRIRRWTGTATTRRGRTSWEDRHTRKHRLSEKATAAPEVNACLDTTF